MTDIETIMEAHSDKPGVRKLHAAYGAILTTMRVQAEWLRRSGPEFAHEADCLDSMARSAEQNFARQMREAVKREAAKVAT